jgi:hypothetical protein
MIANMQKSGDPEADEVVKAWAAQRDAPIGQVFNDFRKALDSGDQAPPSFTAFLDHMQPLPDWAKAEQIHLAQHTFHRWAPEFLAALFVAALPTGYASMHVADVLFRTTQLAKPETMVRRVHETAWWVMQICDGAALEPGGIAYRASRRIRLFHAGVRYCVLRGLDVGNPDRPWDDARSIPLNQEDLFGGVFAIALPTLDVFERSGIDLSVEQREAWIHLWSVVGWILGAGSGLEAMSQMPLTLDNARECLEAIQERQNGASDAGRHLMKTLVDDLQRRLPLSFLDGIIPTAIRHYLGAGVAEMLGVAGANWTRVLFLPARLTFVLASKVSGPPLFDLVTDEILLQYLARALGYAPMSRWDQLHQIAPSVLTRPIGGLLPSSHGTVLEVEEPLAPGAAIRSVHQLQPSLASRMAPRVDQRLAARLRARSSWLTSSMNRTGSTSRLTM